MSFLEKRPRKWRDRRDGHLVKDAPGLNVVLASLFPKRTDCEVYLQQDIDVTELLKYVEAKNGPDAPYKTTMFHCFVTMIARLLNERRYLNRFIQGRRIYERDQIDIGFIAKKRFEDHSEEALMIYTPKGTDTLEDVSRKIVGDVHKAREKKSGGKGVNDMMDTLAHLPRLLRMFVIHLGHFMDFWGIEPKALTESDTNFASVLVSNLGSIHCPSVYHHLNNYGTTSIVITIGTIHKVSTLQPDGSVLTRDVVDIGATLDERMADGFYFARSLKLFQYMSSHPELLDQPLEVESGFDFK